MILAVKFVSIPVKDQDVALDFYVNKLGFTVLTDQPMGPGQRWIELRLPRGETGLVLFTPEGHENRIGTFQNLSLRCDDVDRTFAELKAKGVEFDTPPTKQPWGTYMIIKDPDGNRMVVSAS